MKETAKLLTIMSKFKCAVFVLLVALQCILISSSLFSQIPGNTLEFDGLNDYVEIGNPLPIGNISHTIECWVKVPLPGTKNLASDERVGIIIGSYNSSPNSNWEIDHNGVLRIFWNNGEKNILGTTDFRDAKWHHLAIVRDNVGNQFIAYIDGKEELTYGNCGSDIIFTTSHCIGSDQRAGGRPYFNGEIDELRIWSDVRLQEEIQENMYKEIASSEAGLVCNFTFDASSGTILDNAETTSSYDATLNNMDDNDWVKSGAFEGSKRCLEFDGTDDYVYLTNDTELKPTSALTVECWANPSDWTVSGGVEKFIGNTELGGYALSLNNDSLRFQAHNGSVYRIAICPASGISAGWHHIAGVYDGTDIILYLDGVEKDRITFNAAAITYHASNYTIIGAEADVSNGNDGDLYTGQIDEVRIWNDARDAHEIRAYMCRTLLGDEANLLAYYRFDDNEGSILTDIIAGRDGTLLNMDDADWVVSEAFTNWIADYATDWTDTYNWSGNVPNSITDNVGIISGFNPPSIAGNQNCNNVYLELGTTVNVNSGALIVNGNYYQDGDIACYGGGVLTLKSNAGQEDFIRLKIDSQADFAQMPIFNSGGL